MYEGLPLTEVDANVGRIARHERRPLARAGSGEDAGDESDSQLVREHWYS